MKTENNLKTCVVAGILLIFSFYLLPVKAANLTAQSTNPFIYFDDTDESGTEWRMAGDQSRFALYNYDTSKTLLYFDDQAEMQLEMTIRAFSIQDELGNNIVNIDLDAPLSLDIQRFGDVSLAGGDVFIDTSTNRLGIGTTAPIAPIHVTAPVPGIVFEDSDVTGADWRINADQDSFYLYNYDTGNPLLWFDDLADMRLEMWATTFQIQDEAGNPIVNIARDAPLSLDIQSNGDVSLAGGDVFIDTFFNRLGIGTSVPLSDLGIQSLEPGIYLEDTSGGSADWYVGNIFNDLVFKIMTNGTGGPDYSQILTLDAETGYIGMNKATPTAALHVGSPDGESAKVLVENTTAVVAPRTLFELQNAGNTKFTVNNIDAGVQWSFANPGTAFRLSRQGSGFVEFEIFNNGDATLKGALTENSDVNAKQDIEAIDSAAILAKVVAMPISKWSYKDAPDTRHLGPMAQDFRAAFSLGNTDTGIATLDSSGVALAAIQALGEQNQSLVEQNQLMVKQNQSLVEQNQSLEQRVIELEQQNQRMEKQNQRFEELVMRIVTGQAEQLAMN